MIVERDEHLTVANPALDALQAISVPGMAHWAGTGPQGQPCAGCTFFRKRRKRKGEDKDAPREGRCRKFIALCRAARNPAPVFYIEPDTVSCRHFSEKAKA